jgi:preprotein translocase subunit SecE
MALEYVDLQKNIKGYLIDTKANVEANVDAIEGWIAYATDTNEFGSYDGATWTWGQGSGSGGHTIKDEGTPLTARAGLNFVGAGVTATDDAGGDETDVTIPSTAEEIDAASADSIVDADHVGFRQAASGLLKKITWANVKATLKTYFDTLYVIATAFFNDAEGDPQLVSPTTTSDGTSVYAARRDHQHVYFAQDSIGAASEAAVADADHFGFRQNAGGGFKKITWANIKATLKTYFDTLYSVIGHTHAAANLNDLGDVDITTPATGHIIKYNSGTALWYNEILAAIGVPYDPEGSISSGNVQDAISELDSEKSDVAHTHTPAALGAIPNDGWIAGTGTWSYTSADDPTFVMSVPDADAALMEVGDRIKLTQTTTRKFITTAIGSPSGGFTPVTMYGGTDYDLANAAITSPYYSHVKSPLGFPMSKSKWSVVLTDTSDRSKASPAINTLYYSDLGSLNIVFPIGEWDVECELIIGVVSNAAQTIASIQFALSTANNSISDNTLVGYAMTGGASGTLRAVSAVTINKTIAVVAKTTHYLIAQTLHNNIATILFQGTTKTTRVTATSAYL